MKAIIQIPCFNEAETLPETIRDLPKRIPGVQKVELLIIDDGSTDGTAEVARELGVHHIVRFSQNRGLARAFAAGVDACLKLGADIIINTDADNQYHGRDIPKLVKPIIDENVDVVVGDRQTDKIEHFSPLKKKLQKLGSLVVRVLSETEVSDSTSGFRAYKRAAAMHLNVVSPFTYTLETIIQAGKKHMSVANVEIGTNPPTRPSRLFKGMWQYIRRSLVTMVRMYLMYQPLRVFFYLTCLLMGAGGVLVARWGYYHVMLGANADPAHHVQSLVIGVGLIIIGVMAGLIGLLADVVNYNRRLIENTLWHARNLEVSLVEHGIVKWGGNLVHSELEGHQQRLRRGFVADRPTETNPNMPALTPIPAHLRDTQL